MTSRKVYITGLGCVCAAGGGPRAIMASLGRGERHSGPPVRLGPGALPYPVFAVADGFFGAGPRHTAADTLALAEEAARQALARAALEAGSPEVGRMGVCIGTTSGSALHFLEGYGTWRTGQPGSEQDVPDYFSSNPAQALAKRLGAGGPALTVANACTSGSDAIGLAMEWVRQGWCDSVLAGGSDALGLVPHTGFARLMIYDQSPCRPFDASRRGLNLGEGAGLMLLETAEAAARRGARPLGQVLGYGAASDAHHLTAPHPQGRGLRAAIGAAMRQAGAAPADLAFVNVHGTATPDNDRVEGGVLKDLLPRVPAWATKGFTGHALGAAGGIEAVLTVMGLIQGWLPASAGFQEPDPEIGLSPIAEPLALQGGQALSTSLGFGGGNAALVLKGYAGA